MHWIRAEIHEFVLRNWRIVRVATTKAQRKLFFRLRGAKKHLGWLSNEDVGAIATDLGVRAADVLEMAQRLQAQDAAFDGAVDDDDRQHSAPMALLADQGYEPGAALEELEWAGFAAEQLAPALDTLDERSRDIVTRRWLNEPKAPLRELADIYSVSVERVRQIENKAFATLRKALDFDGCGCGPAELPH